MQNILQLEDDLELISSGFHGAQSFQSSFQRKNYVSNM